jgi:hypothetical protein
MILLNRIVPLHQKYFRFFSQKILGWHFAVRKRSIHRFTSFDTNGFTLLTLLILHLN